MWPFSTTKKSANKSKKLKESAETPTTVPDTVSPVRTPSPSTQLSVVQQPAAGEPSSSTSNLTTDTDVSSTPIASDDATTPEAPRQAHANSSQKYEKASDTSVLVLNIVKDFSESDEMFAPLKATCALLLRGLETTKNLHENHKTWKELLEDLEPWITLMEQQKTRLNKKGNISATDEDLRRAVISYTKVVEKAIKEVEEELEKLDTKEFKAQVKRVGTIKIDPERMKRIRQELDEAHKFYSTSTDHVIIGKVDDVGTNVTELQGDVRHVLNIKDRSTLTDECTIREFTHGHRRRSSRHSKTRKELFAKLEQWEKESHGKEQVFWIKDDAGCGKTTVASTKTSDWAGRSLAAQMYCPSDMEGVPKIKDIIRHIAIQLASFKSIRELVLRLLRVTPMAHHNASECFQLLISEPLQKLHQPDPVFLIIDAVDNLGSDEQETLLTILAKQLPKTPAMKVLITSRRSLNILHDLKCDGLLYGASEHTVASDSSNAEDIKQYVYSELDHSIFSDQDREVVVRYSDGRFDIAALICSQLATNRRLAKQIIKGLANGDGLLVGMDGFHENTLRQAFKDKMKPKEREEALQVLQILVTCFEPLSIEGGFSHLLDRNKRDRNDQVPILLHELQALAVLERADDDLQPLVLKNESFKQFVCSEEERAGDFYIDPKEAHSYLGKICIERLSQSIDGFNVLKYDRLGVRRSGYRIPMNSEISDLEARVNKALGEGWRYAAKFWIKHLLAAGDEWRNWDMVLNFLKAHFLHWIELASWMGKLDDVITSLATLQTMVTEERNDAAGSERARLEELSRFLEIGSKYVCCYKDILKESALHAYTLLTTLEHFKLRPVDAVGHKSPKFITSEPIEWDTEASPDPSGMGVFVNDERHFLGTARSPTDGHISVWRATDKGAVRETLLNIAASATSWATNGKELVSVGPRGVEIYDLDTKSPSTKVLPGYSVVDPQTARFSVEGTYLAISSVKMTQVWNYEEGGLIWTSTREALLAISFSPKDASMAITGHRGDKLVFFDLDNKMEFEGPSSDHQYVQTAIHPTESVIIAAHSRSLEVWATVGDRLELVAQAELDSPASASYPLHFAGKKKEHIVYGSWAWSFKRDRDRGTSLVRCDDKVTTCKLDSRGSKHSLLTYHDGWIHSAYHAGPIMPVPPQLRAAFDSEDGWTAKGESILGWIGPNKPVLIDCSPLLTAA